MLNLTDEEITILGLLVADKRTADGEPPLAKTPMGELFQKLFDELHARNLAKQNAEQVSDFEAKRAAKLAKLDAEYPVVVGDTVEVTIGKSTYRAVVRYRSPVPAGAGWMANARQLGLLILRKDGQPNKAMNGKRGEWTGLVRKDDICKWTR